MAGKVGIFSCETGAKQKLETKREVGKTRVLIVDDCTAVRDGLRGILRAHSDIDVVGEAGDGREAVAKAAELRPCVILMDVGMPRMDGLEATRLIKDQSIGPKVLLLTIQLASLEEALAAGADRYLLKGCSSQELVRAIRELGCDS